MPAPVHINGRSSHRIGGICAIGLGVAYLVIIAIYLRIGAPPGALEARLAYIAANTTAWWTILGLSVLTDFLFVPLAFSLYFWLKDLNRYLMLLAVACIMSFVVLDLAITWTNYASLITLSGRYAVAAGEVQRAVIVTAAEYPGAVLQSSLLFVYNTLVPSIGILLTGFVMLRGACGRITAWLGIATGSLGIVSVVGSFFVPALSPAIILASLLTTVWVLVVGYRLCRIDDK